MARPRLSERTAGWAAAAVVMMAGLIALGAGSQVAAQIPVDLPLFGLTTPQTLAVAGIFLVVVYVTATSESEVSVPFLMSGVALFIVAWALLPSSIQSMIPVDAFTPSGFDALTFGLLTGLSILGYYIVAERAGGGAKTASTTAKRVSNDVQDLFGEWAEVTRWFVVGLIGGAALFIGQGAPVIGEIYSLFAEAPAVVGQGLTLLVGWLGFTGRIGIDADGFLLIGLVLFLVVVGVKYGD